MHAAIRDACTRGDSNAVQQLVGSLAKDAELIINMAPSGANTLLFTYEFQLFSSHNSNGFFCAFQCLPNW